MPLDLVAARADPALGRAGGELTAGHLVECGAQETAADVGPELLADARVAQVLLTESAHLLVEIVAVRLGAVGPDPHAQSSVGRFDTVEHLPGAAVRSAAAGQIDIRERLGDRLQRRLLPRPRPPPAPAVRP